MQTLLDYLTQTDGPPPQPEQRPDTARWIAIPDFTLRGNRLSFSDSWCPVDGVTVELPPGPYTLKVLCLRYGHEVRIAAIRAERPGSAGVVGSESLGEFDVDVAAVGITDIDRLEAMPEDAYNQWIDAYCNAEVYSYAGVHAWPEAETAMVFMMSGWGDGYYSVYPLREHGELVGAEVRFIADDETYPFGCV